MEYQQQPKQPTQIIRSGAEQKANQEAARKALYKDFNITTELDRADIYNLIAQASCGVVLSNTPETRPILPEKRIDTSLFGDNNSSDIINQGRGAYIKAIKEINGTYTIYGVIDDGSVAQFARLLKPYIVFNAGQARCNATVVQVKGLTQAEVSRIESEIKSKFGN